MSWFKLDDRFFDNPKIAALSAEAKVAYLEAGTYCARELTDGHVPLNKAKSIAGKPRVLRELVPGLWEPVADGYKVHDYLKYNPTREQVLAEREAAKKRMYGLRSGERSGEQKPNNGRSSGVGTEAPVNPVSPSYSRNTVDPEPVKPEPSTVRTDLGWPEEDEDSPNSFRQTYRRHYEEIKGPISGNKMLKAGQLERQFGTRACIEVAASLGWEKHPNYYVGALEDMFSERKPVGRNGSPAQAPIDSAAAIRLAYPGIKTWDEPEPGAGDGGLAPVDGGDDSSRLEVRR